MADVRRVFVEKKPEFAVESSQLLNDLQENLGIRGLTGLRLFKRYDLSGITDQEFIATKDSILSEPNCDVVYEEKLPTVEGTIIALEYLPGQYDQRADSAAQCVQLLTQKERPLVRTATVYNLIGTLTKKDVKRISDYLMNPVESRLASMEKPESLEMETTVPPDVRIMDGFMDKTPEQLKAMVEDLGLAMSVEDLAFCQKYFRDEEKRNPSFTELRVIDTYWSDHCRHTTFQTCIDKVEFSDDPLSAPVKEDYQKYIDLKKELGREKKDVCLMDMATIGARILKKQGKLDNFDKSEEINACSIIIEADVDGKKEPWLIMFKNETHNHPTEIEPFGGAATCLGGAIRDPLSGRSYVYQAMRITGAADPRTSLADTLPGKLAQKKIVRTAAAGYSSYGNQIGLATGKVQEVYHPGFVAKRLELGAVIAAAPQKNVVREVPEPGNLILLIGGRTGRDGCGGATGSSKAHTGKSLQTCSAEVQKGNPLTERNIQRLFRREEFSHLIKRCNDFGAGGVCVAIGELAPGLHIDLNKVPKKYEGLDGTELAISESQERMAVVIDARDLAPVMKLIQSENLEGTLVAKVCEENRLTMKWRDKNIVNLSRAFLDTNGVTQHAIAKVYAPVAEMNPFAKNYSHLGIDEHWKRILKDLNVCSQKGLVERFDGSIGAESILSPFGGKMRLTPTEAMAAKIPVKGKTNTCTIMSHGYDPELCSWSPYHGALYSVVAANAKIAAAGGNVCDVRMSFQEYFERLGTKPTSWGKPLAALLGGLRGQLEFGTAAIGGKDSMSGTFENISVPPTLVAFAVAPAKADKIISPEFKKAGNMISLLKAKRKADGTPDFDELRRNYAMLYQWIQDGKVVSAHTLGYGGAAAVLPKMCFGNWLGAALKDSWDLRQDLFCPGHGNIILESTELLDDAQCIGKVSAAPEITIGDYCLELKEALEIWQAPLEHVYPTKAKPAPEPIIWQPYSNRGKLKPVIKVAKPRVFIPVFPGTNCEYDTAKAFEFAGAVAEKVIIRNLSAADIENSADAVVKAIDNAQIVAFPGGFSGGDEPDGSGKFIATTFRNPRVMEAMMRLLKDRDGLVLGICNGFQALIKLGLVPYGEIRTSLQPTDPTLTFNNIGRHAATIINTVVSSVKSPWLQHCNVGDLHSVAISHGEGRFFASEAQVKELLKNGQVAFQYADNDGKISADMPWNPNGSVCAIEGITSPDGRILGKMGHSERSVDSDVNINVPGNKQQGIFRSGVEYFA
ncbi:MAG: phosphoribosylformylglycinamidine synthase [Lentisphaeria bacterium]